MKGMIIALSSFFFLISAVPVDDTDQLKHGVELYNKGKLDKALEAFLKAEKADPKAPLPKYNAMEVMAETKKLNELEKKLTTDFSTLGEQGDIRAKSAYNLGTAYLKQVDAADKAGQLQSKAKELDSAVSWLRQALLDDSVDSEAKNNLEYANKLKDKLEKQQQNQQDKQNKQDKQDKKDQKQNQKDQKQQEDKNQKQDQQNQQKQQNQQQQQNQQERKEQQEREISNDMAHNLLQAARDAEKKALKMLRAQLKKKAGKKPHKEKDW